MTYQYENDVIDLTEDSYTLVSHCNMMREVIELDDSVLGNDNHYRPASKNRSAKAKKPPAPKKTNLVRSPTKVEKPKEKNKAGIGNCPICWNKLGTNPMASTKCGHVYCMKCLEQCLKRERSCPTCRRVLKGNSAYHPLYLSYS